MELIENVKQLDMIIICVVNLKFIGRNIFQGMIQDEPIINIKSVIIVSFLK